MNENNKETQMQEASESETYAVDFRGGLDDGVTILTITIKKVMTTRRKFRNKSPKIINIQ